MNRIMNVYYGVDSLPYKDKERTIHFPIIGNAFAGSSNYNKIRFYVQEIGGVNAVTWIAITKLPNGRVIYEPLSTIGLEDGENYLELDISSYYTQVKGDIYISLNGCDGDVTITEDSETHIQDIEATLNQSTIVTTGPIKLPINYAVQRPYGFSFDIDQYQAILNALSDKANVFTTIQVISSIASVDPDNFEIGQLFYSVGSGENRYYKLALVSGNKTLSPTILDGANKMLRYIVSSDETIIAVALMLLGRIGILNVNSIDYLMQTDSTNIVLLDFVNQKYYKAPLLSVSTIGQVINNTYAFEYLEKTHNVFVVYGTDLEGDQITIPYSSSDIKDTIVLRDNVQGNINTALTPTANSHATSKYYVDTNYVPYSGALYDVNIGNHYFKCASLRIGGNFHTIQRVEDNLIIGTFVGDIDLQPSGKALYNGSEIAKYSQVVSAQTTLQANIDASGHSLAISGGIETDFEYTITLKDSNNNTLSSITFDLPLESVVVSGTYDSVNKEIVLTLEDGSTIEIPVGDLVSGLASQEDLNSLSATVTTNNNNAFKYSDITIVGGYVGALKKNNVDYPIASNVTTYTTPKVVATTSDLPEENDGYLYLVVADGYLYYWDVDTSAWVQGSEYATDLNQYVQVTRTIAGIDLSANISAQALTDALVLASNTDIDNLF